MADVRRDRGRARPASSWSGRSPSSRTRCCRGTTARWTPARPGSCCWRAPAAVLPTVRPEAAALHPRAPGEDGRRDPAEHPGRRRWTTSRVTVKGPDGEETIRTRTRIWAAGRAGLTAGGDARRAKTGAETDRAGRIPVNPDCTLPGHPEVFADRRHGVAEQAARRRPAGHAGGQVRRQGDQGAAGRGREDRQPFKYFDKGSMATIGHRSAVADAFGMKFTGVLGYTMWGFIHVLYLIGWGNRLGTLYTWARALTFSQQPRPPDHHVRAGPRPHPGASRCAPGTRRTRPGSRCTRRWAGRRARRRGRCG